MCEASLLPNCDRIEVRRAAVNMRYDRYITSIVDGWRKHTYLLGKGKEHTDIIPGSTIGYPDARLGILHPLEEEHCARLDAQTISNIHSELSRIQWVCHKHHMWLPEMLLYPEPSRKCSPDRFPYEDNFENKSPPGELVLAYSRWLPEQFFVHRLWRVLNGQRAGTWLCEECEQPSKSCDCPRELNKSHKFQLWYFGPWWDGEDTQENYRGSIRPPVNEGWAFMHWREMGWPEMFLDRRQFGIHASDPGKYDENYTEADEKRQERMLDEIEVQIRRLELSK